MGASKWELLQGIARQPQPLSWQTWRTHRAIYRQWLGTPLREQAIEIRAYLTYGGAILQDWSSLIPTEEYPESEQVFQTDLDSLFRILGLPEPTARRTAPKLRTLQCRG